MLDVLVYTIRECRASKSHSQRWQYFHLSLQCSK